MSETKAVASVILEARAKAKIAYDSMVAKLDAIELAAARAEQLAVEWKNSAEGRDARVWFWDSHPTITLVLVLNRGDEFGVAADHFALALQQFSSAFPEGWVVEEEAEARDATYSADCAARAISVDARPPGGGYMESVHASVRVELPVKAGDSCRVIKIGERPAVSASYFASSPIYKAICPGDAFPPGGA